MGDIAVGSREVRPLLRKYRQPLYDEEVVGAGVAVNTINLFANRRGTQDRAGRTKTARDTNLLANGELGAKQEFYLVGFNVMLDWDELATEDMRSAADNASNQLYVVQQIITDSLFEFAFGRQTALVEIPLERIPFGMGPYGSINNAHVRAATEVAQVLTNGIPSCKEFYDVRLKKNKPRHIQPDQSFTCEISWPNGAITVGNTSDADYYRVMVYAIGVLLSAM